MKRENILLIVFFLTLFVFQQAQAGAKIYSDENSPNIKNSQTNANILYTNVHVYVYKLADGSGALLPSHERCIWPYHIGVYGCGDTWPNLPLEPEGYLRVPVEQNYLRDVIATEMNLAQISPEPEALKAQTVASRSVASWKSQYGPWDDGNGEPDGVWPRINNSSTYQVFIPDVHIISVYKDAIDSAVDETNGEYLYYLYGNSTYIDAEFGADMELATNDEHSTDPGFIKKPYLKGISDPISKSCIVNVSGSHDYGMSQRGAIRWAKGNTCPDGSGTVWPVKWDYKQILAHYYTGIDFINDNSGAKIAPDYRWNLLHHDAPQEMPAGQVRKITLHIQNTSAFDWDETVSLRWKLTSACRTADAV